MNFNEAISWNSDYIEAYEYRAKAHRKAGKVSLAEADEKKVAASRSNQ